VQNSVAASPPNVIHFFCNRRFSLTLPLDFALLACFISSFFQPQSPFRASLALFLNIDM
jgi:hypothetical protein